MNGKTYPYLELAALPPVGAALLDSRPAFVFRGDGSAILWANAAGAAFFGEEMGPLLHRRFGAASAFARQLARLARLLPADQPRLEILRFNLGVRVEALAAACRRLHLADGASAVLAIGQTPVRRESLATRAERLADSIASKECLVAVLAGDGRVLGASGCFDAVAPASAAIDSMIDAVSAAPQVLLKRPLDVDGETRPAGIVRFTEGTLVLFLLIVGPAEEIAEQVPVAEPAPVPTALPGDESKPGEAGAGNSAATGTSSGEQASRMEHETAPPQEPSVAPSGETVSSPGDDLSTAAQSHEQAAPDARPAEAGADQAAQPESLQPAGIEPGRGDERPLSRSAIFLWQTDSNQRFSFVSPVLAATVGPAAAAIMGRTWHEIAERFSLDPAGRIARCMAGEATWNGETVHWPVGDGRERLAIELSAIPVFDKGHRFAGFRGFGSVRLDQRSPGSVFIPFGPDSRGSSSEPPAALPSPGPASEVEAPTTIDEEPAAATIAEPFPTLQLEPSPGPEAASSAESQPGEGRPATTRLRLSGEDDIDVVARKSIEQGAEHANVPDEPPTSEIEPEATLPAETQAIEPPPVSPTSAPASPSEPSLPVAPAAPSSAAAARPPASNVVRLPGTPVRALPTEKLSGTEQDAFRRIAEALGVKMPEGMRDEGRPGDATSRAPPQNGGEPDTRFLDKLPVGIVIYRERGILFVNRTLLDYLGYETPEEFAKAGGADAIFPDRGKAETAFPDADGILTARRRDGVDLRVEARLHAVPWGPATALMLSLVKRETAAEPARNEDLVDHLVAAERRIDELATILDTATDGIIVIDEHGRIENINRSAEALFGVEAAEVLRQPFTELFAEESRKAAIDYLDGLAANGVASVLNDGREVIGKVPKGGLIPLFMTMGRLGGGPKFCAVLRDITHWKNVEEELLAAKRAAEAANAQKSEFLAKISHEIRTPLNAIIGFSEVMMGERFGPVGNERYRDYLRDIHVSGEHLMSLINDLLDLSKIEAGKLELAFEAVAVNETIQECVALMQPQANRERIIIRTSLSAGVPNVVADQRSLRQILLNLLSNAIKFTGAGGQVIVATTLEESGEVVLRIRDTGIGMTEKDLETAMKPFRQVTTTGTRRAEGTGLGLPLTKALVEANRAAFSIDSAPNQGTLVKITFPTTRVLAG